MDTQTLKKFNRRYDRFMLEERLGVLEHFDDYFKRQLKGELNPGIRVMYEDMVKWNSKQRLKMLEELL